MVKKKILLICKETFAYPLYFLAKKWCKDNEVAAFFFMPAECKYDVCDLNRSTYYKFKEIKEINTFDVCEIADEFTKKLNDLDVDDDYLRNVEKKYTYFKNLRLQLTTSQFTTRQFHYRNYMKLFNQKQEENWLILNYKRVISIIDEFNPDVIIDYDDAELVRSIINEIAYDRKIPYITINHPRYEDYKIFTFTMGIGMEKYFEDEYHEFYKQNQTELREEYKYIYDYRKRNSIMPDEYKNTITANYKKEGIFTAIKRMLFQINYFVKQDLSGDNFWLKRNNPYIYPNSLEYIKYYLRVCVNRRKLATKNKYFSDPCLGEKYVYMPLHLIPESTTFVKAPFYTNELMLIEAVSKALPVGWKLYVKEHQAMLGERGLEFYKNVNRIPNVKMVQYNYYNDPKPWIANSLGVITITGTAAYEAALMGKRSLIFGDVPFGLIEGITKVDSFEKLPRLLANISDPIDNIHSCAAYIATVKKLGEPIKYKYLMQEGYEILNHNKEITNKYKEEIDNLDNFYNKAYKKYKELFC